MVQVENSMSDIHQCPTQQMHPQTQQQLMTQNDKVSATQPMECNEREQVVLLTSDCDNSASSDVSEFSSVVRNERNKENNNEAINQHQQPVAQTEIISDVDTINSSVSDLSKTNKQKSKPVAGKKR